MPTRVLISPSTKDREKGVAAQLLRMLPAVDQLLLSTPFQSLMELYPREAVVDIVRSQLADLRRHARAGKFDALHLQQALDSFPSAVQVELEKRFSFSLKKVINATGVILHTNLGRAPLSDAVWMRLREVAAGYSNLEFDLEKNERGRRDIHVERLFKLLVPVESVLVVNNNAGAVLLALNSLAEGGEVIVSRGELVEIGESFRVPEIMRKSQAVLREIGATNRTRLDDYARALNKNTRLILRVHRSNFRVVGFTEQPPLDSLVRLGHRKRLPMMEDLGSGCLVDLSPLGISEEPTVAQSIRAGVDVVTFSGDKLLGGPQAGIILGRKKYLSLMRSNPLYRALRVDKLTLAALEVTLLDYLRKEEKESLPVLRMVFAPAGEIRARAEALIDKVRQLLPQHTSTRLEIVEGRSVIGGGSAPGEAIPTFLISLSVESRSANAVEKQLRNQAVPILARVENNQAVLDLRTVLPEEEAPIVDALTKLAAPTH